MTSKTLTNIDLYKMSCLLAYDLWMLCELSEKAYDDLHIVIRNALNESFVIHARNLIEFFYTKRMSQGNIIASQFFDNNEWDSLIKNKCVILTQFKIRASQYVMHLSSKRLHPADDDYQLDYEKIRDEILKIAIFFFKEVSREKINIFALQQISKYLPPELHVFDK